MVRAHHRIFRPPFCQSSKQVIFRIFPKNREWCLQTPSNKVHRPDIGRGGVPRPYRARVPPLGHKTCLFLRACTPKPNVAKPFLCVHTQHDEKRQLRYYLSVRPGAMRAQPYTLNVRQKTARERVIIWPRFSIKKIFAHANRHVATDKTKNK